MVDRVEDIQKTQGARAYPFRVKLGQGYNELYVALLHMGSSFIKIFQTFCSHKL